MTSPSRMTSMSKDLRETSRATAAASKATSAETAELSQETPATTASASNSGVSGAESSVSPVSEKLAIVTSNTPGENTLEPLTAMHTVQRPEITARTGTSGASPERTPRASPGAGACASDEHTASGGGCVCKANFYNHTELSRTSVALHCQPRTIEVVLHSCFLDTHHWMLKKGAFSGCSSVSTIQQSRRVQVFTLEKKEDACGLRLSTNNSHAVYSLEVEFLRVLPGFNLTDSTKLSFSCLYPLVVTVSQNQPYPVVSFPTIHIPGTGDVIVILGIFTDPQLSTPLENRTVPLGTPLHVVLRATSSDPDRFALVADEVFASTNTSRTGTTKTTYHFVKDSCPVSNRLLQGLQANGDSLQVTLAFNLFHLAARDPFYL
ncbi:uncharacterized protein LOC102501599, partial [Tupaia chinensis]|uniref:uncharacterized protein LOC102501599 n=1 Tax=Tupaia chinensis TaxID=246437 RepID=UPI0003C8E2F5